MRLALAQINPTIGAIKDNADRILASLSSAKAKGADLAVFPELCLCGYPPLDLLERRRFVEKCEEEIARIVAEMPAGIVAVFGSVLKRIAPDFAPGRPLINAAVVAKKGEVILRAAKTLLPVYDVFDEARYFEPAPQEQDARFDLDGETVAVTICEDLWNDKELWTERLYRDDPVERLVARGARIVLNLSCSPWSLGKEKLRRSLVEHAAKRHGVWSVLVNQVGGNDGLIFDGDSVAFGPDGTLQAEAAAFKEDLIVLDTDRLEPIEPRPTDPIAQVHDALVLGIRDYFGKCGFKRAVIALSGGIDSAVTCVLAVEALGAECVTGLGMPSRYSSEGSVSDAKVLAENLGIRFEILPIEPMFKAYLEALDPIFKGTKADVTEENLQSRIRGAAVMAYSNKFSALVLTTGNKSEAAVGYCTLYGDTNGGLAPIADLYKQQVYALARYMNRTREVVPESTITKAPSAELRPNQTDQDSLPPYPVLDEILRLLIEERASVAEIAGATGQSEALVREIVHKVSIAEFKRQQFAPTLRVSSKAWVGRVYPIAHRFRE